MEVTENRIDTLTYCGLKHFRLSSVPLTFVKCTRQNYDPTGTVIISKLDTHYR